MVKLSRISLALTFSALGATLLPRVGVEAFLSADLTFGVATGFTLDATLAVIVVTLGVGLAGVAVRLAATASLGSATGLAAGCAAGEALAVARARVAFLGCAGAFTAGAGATSVAVTTVSAVVETASVEDVLDVLDVWVASAASDFWGSIKAYALMV